LRKKISQNPRVTPWRLYLGKVFLLLYAVFLVELYLEMGVWAEGREGDERRELKGGS
jgi:hypothetical protein